MLLKAPTLANWKKSWHLWFTLSCNGDKTACVADCSLLNPVMGMWGCLRLMSSTSVGMWASSLSPGCHVTHLARPPLAFVPVYRGGSWAPQVGCSVSGRRTSWRAGLEPRPRPGFWASLDRVVRKHALAPGHALPAHLGFPVPLTRGPKWAWDVSHLQQQRQEEKSLRAVFHVEAEDVLCVSFSPGCCLFWNDTKGISFLILSQEWVSFSKP